MRSSIILFILVMLLFFSSACDSNRYFEQNKEIEKESWFYKDIKTFTIDIEDTSSLFNFYLNIRNTTDYPFSNLYLFMESEMPNSHTARDTIELQLAYLNGKWLGSGYGRYKYTQFILRKGMRFGAKGTYTFHIQHGMRKDTLKGISDLGIRIEYNNQF
jgi:gliding motility-associated lipoprotein GldH